MGDDITVLDLEDVSNINNATSESEEPPGEMHCGHGDLMGPLGLFVQGLLAFIAFASLIGTAFIKSNLLRSSPHKKFCVVNLTGFF